jgi:hypothetical protein
VLQGIHSNSFGKLCIEYEGWGAGKTNMETSGFVIPKRWTAAVHYLISLLGRCINTRLEVGNV